MRGEAEKLGDLILKLISLPGKSRKQSINALSLVLSDSPFYSLLSTLPEPDHTNPEANSLYKLQTILADTLPTLKELIESIQSEQDEHIFREVSKRRTRLTSVPKTAAQTKADVINEIYPSSLLPKFWRQVLDHPLADDQSRREVEAKLLSFYLEWLESLPCPFPDEVSDTTRAVKFDSSAGSCKTDHDLESAKDSVRGKIEELARGQAILKVPNQKAWDIVIDWGEILPESESTDPYGFLGLLTEAMPNSPLSNLVLAFQQMHQEGGVEEKPTFEEPLEQIDLAFEAAQDHSILAHVLATSVHFELKEWSTVIQIAEQGIKKVKSLEQMIGKRLFKARRRLITHLACALTYENPPIHHLRGDRYLDEILSDEPNNALVLMAKAHVSSHRKQWQLAADFFSRTLEASSDLSNHEVLELQSEKAWCLYELGQTNLAAQELQQIIDGFEKLVDEHTEGDGLAYNLAKSWYRLGRCHWTLSHPQNQTVQKPHVGSLEDALQRAYTCFIKSIKYDTSIASAFTHLGLYYAEKNDHTRSSKCFQRAFELDASEEIAAFQLASEFAENQQWDLVEVVTKRLLFGRVSQKPQLLMDDDHHPSVGSLASYQQHIWAWKAAGVVELSRGKYVAAIQTFQRATRCAPKDYQVWLKLGLAYQGAGKHVAALKSFITARQLVDEPTQDLTSISSHEATAWYIDFCVGDAQRRVGILEPAIKILDKIVQQRPDEVGVKIILAETRYTKALNNSQRGAFDEAENELITCLDLVHEVLQLAKSKVSIKAGWKIAGNVLAEFARWNRTIPITTFNVNAGKADSSEKLRAHLSYLINLAAKMNVDNILASIKSVTCLELTAILSENGSSGVFLLASNLAFKVRLIIDIHAKQSDYTAQAWSDLAISLGSLSRWLESTSRKLSSADPTTSFKTQLGPKGTLAEAVYCIKAALKLNSFSSSAWNILGVLTFNLNPRLCQHAFIRSVELGPKNHVAWANLGFFYLAHSDLELANEAFDKSQLIEPDWPLPWMGIALISSIQEQEQKACEMVEHAYTLSLGSISTIESSYAAMSWKLFTDQAKNSAQHTSTLLAPMLAAQKLLKRYPTDPTILNLHALISESLGRLDQAAESLEKSTEILEAAYEVTESAEAEQRYMLSKLNLGRVHLRQKNYSEAIESLETVLSLRPPFQRATDPVDDAFKITILRAQAACEIATARHYLQDTTNCLIGLREAHHEIKSMQKEDSFGLGKALIPYSSSVAGLIARVLWSQSNKQEAKELISETILENSSEEIVDFDLVSSFLAISILEASDEELQLSFLTKQEPNDESVEKPRDDGLIESRTARHECAETTSRLENLMNQRGSNRKITRDFKRETNTILKFMEFAAKALSEQRKNRPDHPQYNLLQSFENVKRILGGCIRQVRESEADQKAFLQRSIIFKSYDDYDPLSTDLNEGNSHFQDKNLITSLMDKIQHLSGFKNLCLSEQLDP